jgi:predicted DNA-binding transcriptional regulator
MGRIAGWLLLTLAVFMFVGYLGAAVSGPAAIAALIIAVGLPAAGGIALIRGGGSAGRKLTARREELRRDTLQSEMLRLAMQHQGRITIVEAVAALAISPEEAKDALDSLAVRGLADFEVTDSGVVVYVFHDVQGLNEKHRSKGLLE